VTRSPFRIFYAAGPGDVIGTYRHSAAGRDDPSQVAVTYSAQFFDLCRSTGAAGYVMSSHPRRDVVTDGAFRVEHRPIAFSKGPAPLYHLGQIWSGVRMVASVVRFRADAAVVSGGTHWFLLALLPLLGVRVIPTLHCVLWRKSRRPRGLNRLFHRLNAAFFRRAPVAILSLSRDITAQLDELTGGGHPEVIPFLPSYRRGAVDPAGDPPAPPPFRVLFAGRIERNKGVFDLLQVAERFAAAGRTDVEFDLCGDGSALAELRRAAGASAAAPRFRCHGHLDRRRMREMYASAHAVVAPTTSAFIEGFNKVVAEAVLAGRPVITSSVCPALEYVRGAVVEVPPDDVAAYGDAILSLAGDPFRWRMLREGCGEVGEQFYDVERSWGAALAQALHRIA
jgi:glycosyltransferase involved in cell wall biosynthesis